MRIDLNAQISLASIGAVVGAFFSWWHAQLLALLPLSWRTRLTRRLERPRLLLDEDILKAKLAPDGISSRRSFKLGDLAGAREEIAREKPHWLTRRIDIELNPEEVLLRRVSLPAAASSRLTDAIKLQLGRLSPFHGEDVRFDYRVVGEIAGEVEIELALIPNRLLQNHEARLRSLGLAVHRFCVADSPLRFRPVARQRGRHETVRWVLGGAACALWLAAVFLAPSLRDAEMAILSNKTATLRVLGEKGAELKNKVEQARGAAELAAGMTAAKSPLAVLNLLTELTPNDAQVLSLSLEDNHLEIEGVAANALWTMNKLGRSKDFKGVRLVSPAPTGAHTIEHFHIEAELASAQRAQGGTP